MLHILPITIRHLTVLLFFVVAHSNLCGQVKDLGLPYINNFTRNYYKAGTQNWSIAQDERGFMYFGNNDGLLRYDGNDWQTYALPNGSIIRSVKCADGKVYVGGWDEFGFFGYDSLGNFAYTSLANRLDNKHRTGFDEIWRIHATRYGVVFQSYLNVFVWQDDELSRIEPLSKFGFSYMANEHLFVIDQGKGLFLLQDRQLNPIYLDGTFFRKNEISFLLSTPNNTYLLGTTNNGVYVYDGQSLKPWSAAINQGLQRDQIFTAIDLGHDQIAVGTIQNGVFILNKNGKVVQHLNRNKGLQNNTVLSLFMDRHENLWLGLDDGIDMLEVSSPMSVLNYCYNIETAYTSIAHRGILYVGTNQGLLAHKLNNLDNNSLIQSGFRFIEGTKGQVWKLKLLDSILVCGHNLGTFQVDGFLARKISDAQGGWDYVQLPGQPQYMVGGTYNGLQLYEKSANKKSWVNIGKIAGLDESCRELASDQSGNLWMNHGHKGTYRIRLSDNLRQVSSLRRYNQEQGLPPLPYTFGHIKGRHYLVTKDGLLVHDQAKDDFYNDDVVTPLINQLKPTKLFEDRYGDIWFTTKQDFGVFRLLEDGSYKKITLPFLRVKEEFLGSLFENIYTLDRDNVLIGGIKGLLHYRAGKQKDFDVDFRVFMKNVRFTGQQQDSLLLRLASGNASASIDNPFAYRINSFSVDFLSPYFEAPFHNKFSHRLLGYNNSWSPWSANTFKEYTNLREGYYIFELKAQNIYTKQSSASRFAFKIAPPLYRSTLAYVLYSAWLIILVSLILLLYIRKHRKELKSLDEKHEEEVRQSEEEIAKLRNEKLKVDVKHKNMELANVTMHLIQKNEFLTKLKTDLSRMWDEAKVERVKTDIKKIIRKIDNDFKNEKHWEVFDKYFEEVHHDFITRLRAAYPDLSSKDLRLCAYLRMNLTTKEIAPLMNMSPRGLEISRYRLRKKLNMDRADNLSQFMSNF